MSPGPRISLCFCGLPAMALCQRTAFRIQTTRFLCTNTFISPHQHAEAVTSVRPTSSRWEVSLPNNMARSLKNSSLLAHRIGTLELQEEPFRGPARAWSVCLAVLQFMVFFILFFIWCWLIPSGFGDVAKECPSETGRRGDALRSGRDILCVQPEPIQPWDQPSRSAQRVNACLRYALLAAAPSRAPISWTATLTVFIVSTGHRRTRKCENSQKALLLSASLSLSLLRHSIPLFRASHSPLHLLAVQRKTILATFDACSR